MQTIRIIYVNCSLPALNVSEQFRTNIGLVNPSESEAIVVLALQKIPGRNIGVVSRVIPARLRGGEVKAQTRAHTHTWRSRSDYERERKRRGHAPHL